MNKTQALKELIEAVGDYRRFNSVSTWNNLLIAHDAYLAAKDEKCPACDYNRTAPTPYFFVGCNHKYCSDCGRRFDAPEKVSPPKITESGHCDDPELKKSAIEPLEPATPTTSSTTILARLWNKNKEILAWINAHEKEG